MYYAQLILILIGTFGATVTARGEELSGYASEVLQLADDQSHQTESIPHLLIKRVSAGDFELAFEKTTLGDLQRYFGGTIRTQAGSEKNISWLCFFGTERPFTVWFISTGSGGSQKTLSGIILKSNSAANQACDSAPKSLAAINWDAPAIGDPEANIIQRFGIPRSALGTDLVMENLSAPRGNGLPTLQTLFYRLVNGAIDGAAFFQITVPR